MDRLLAQETATHSSVSCSLCLSCYHESFQDLLLTINQCCCQWIMPSSGWTLKQTKQLHDMGLPAMMSNERAPCTGKWRGWSGKFAVVPSLDSFPKWMPTVHYLERWQFWALHWRSTSPKHRPPHAGMKSSAPDTHHLWLSSLWVLTSISLTLQHPKKICG